MAAISVESSALEDGPCGMAPGAAARLLSACRVLTPPVGRLSGCSGPNNHGTTMACAVSGAARGGVPQRRFMRDSFHYRA